MTSSSHRPNVDRTPHPDQLPRVLLVAGTPAEMQAWRRLLPTGYLYAEAADLPAALHRLERETYAAVIVDHDLPGTSGVECLVQLRDRFPDVTRLLALGDSAEVDVVAAINQAGVFRCLRKPLNPGHVAEALDLAIRAAVPLSLSSDYTTAIEAALAQILLDRNTHGLFWKDLDSVYVGCNERFAGWHGLPSARDIAGRTDADLPWTQDAGWHRESDVEVMRGGLPHISNAAFRPRNGTGTHEITMQKHALTDRHGRAIGVLGICDEFTSSSRLETMLGEEHDRNRILAELSTDFVMSIRVLEDEALELEWISREIAQDVGVSGSGAMSSLLAATHPDDRAQSQERLKRVLRGEQTAGEMRVRTTAGKEIWLATVARPVWDEHRTRVTRVYAAAKDITQRKLAEIALRDSEARFRSVVETSPDAIAVADRDGRFVTVNEQAARLHGYESAQELLASHRHGLAFLAPQDHARISELTRQLWRQDTSVHAECMLLRKDGTAFPAELSISVARNSQGDVIGHTVISRDISSRKADEAIRTQQARDLATLQERQRLARDLHDAVSQLLFSANILADITLRSWNGGHVDAIQPNLEQIVMLTRSAQTEMRILLLELHPAAFKQSSLVDLLTYLIDMQSVRMGIACTLDAESEPVLPPHVAIVFYRIAQEALNNVAKHASAREVKIRLQEIKNTIQLSIEDDGLGFGVNEIPDDRMGLTNMRERATSIGAQLSIVSNPTTGTTITIVWTQKRD